MVKKVLFTSVLVFLLLLGFTGGFMAHLYLYPKQEFSRFYQKIFHEVGEGRWVHRSQLSDHTFTEFPRPNNDTLYSHCMLNLDNGPVVIEIPAIDRYWCVQFIRNNTDTFHYVGSRLQGLNKETKVLLVPMGYKGKKSDLEIIYAPTKEVWLFARILVKDEKDIQNVTKFQEKFRCIPFSQYQQKSY